MDKNSEEVQAIFKTWKAEIRKIRHFGQFYAGDDYTEKFNEMQFFIEDLERQLWALGWGINEDDQLHEV